MSQKLHKFTLFAAIIMMICKLISFFKKKDIYFFLNIFHKKYSAGLSIFIGCFFDFTYKELESKCKLF